MYYDGPELTDRVGDITGATVEELAELDQFHALGLPGTLALAELAELSPGERVLDLGAGIGGPARVLASRYGAIVTAVEPTGRFRRLAERLNDATGIEVHVVDARGEALPFEDDAFDLVWTQAVLANVEDLDALANEVHRVLVPGGRWALTDMVAGPGGALVFPVPWGDTPRDSHLRTPEDLRATLERPGFAAEAWEVGPAALARAGALAASLPGPPRTLVDATVLMPDRETRMATLARNIGEQRIAPVQAVLRAAGLR